MFSRYQKDSQELVVYILSRLSIASKLALSTYTHVDTGFEACKARVDHFGLWDLVLKTHLYGSARTKQRFMVELLSCKQSGSHEAFIGDIRARMKLVVGAFTKKEAPDSIKVDDLLKCIYINGLDQVYFDRPINRLVEDMPNATADEAMSLCQAFSLERGPSSAVESTSFSGKVLLTAADPALLSLPHVHGVNLGSLPAGSSFCAHCWSFGFKNSHLAATCPYHLRRLARRAKLSTLMACTTVGADFAPYSALAVGADWSARGLVVRDNVWWGQSQWFYDNCASFSMVNMLSFLLEPFRLDKPIRVGGLKDGVLVTHSGFIPFLPRAIALAYFSAAASACLISLGFIQSRGGYYHSVGFDQLSVQHPKGQVSG